MTVQPVRQTGRTAPAPPAGALTGALPWVERARRSVVRVLRGPRGAGAGIVWELPNQILTNHHVIAGPGTGVEVLSGDGGRYPARVVAASADLDLALLEVEHASLRPARIGNSTTLRVGELLFAIGHPWGEPDVVTMGVVGSLEPVKRQGGGTVRLIRSDVPLAPGNSGGPLLDAEGRVVGINAMIFGGDLSLSVPTQVARDWLRTGAGPGAGFAEEPTPL